MSGTGVSRVLRQLTDNLPLSEVDSVALQHIWGRLLTVNVTYSSITSAHSFLPKERTSRLNTLRRQLRLQGKLNVG